MSITPGKSSNSTGFLRETDLHLVTPSFVKVNRSTGQPGNHDIQLFLQSGGRAQMILIHDCQCGFWVWMSQLRFCYPGDCRQIENAVPSIQKLPVAICIHPCFFCFFVKMWQRLLFWRRAAIPRCGTNPSDGSTAAKIRAFICYINTQGAQLALINSREF